MHMNSVLPAVLFFAWLIRQGRQASVIIWKISTRDPGITVPESQLTGLPQITNVIFVAFN